MSYSKWTHSQEFLSQFQSSCSALESSIESAKAVLPVPSERLQAFSMGLAKLAKGLADVTGSLPSYDQRRCESQLKALEKNLEGVRNSSMCKPKFTFKAKTTPSGAPPSSPISPTPDLIKHPQSDFSAPSTHLKLSSHTNSYLTLDSLPDTLLSSKHSDLTLSDLQDCIVNLIPPMLKLGTDQEHMQHNFLDISALHIRNLTNTVLLLPAIKGSTLLHDLHRCVVVVGCHQFRIHNSTNVDVYLSIPSNPVIEHCSHIRFAAYPATLSTQDLDTEASKHLSVQDFSHIRSTPSPHWSILASEEQIQEWPSSIVKGREHIDTILQSILPRPNSVD